MIKNTAIFSFFILFSLSSCCVAAEDSTSVYRYQLLYRSTLDLRRSSDVFPWNDPEAEAHLSDRFAGMAFFEPYRGLGLFVKGATGERAEESPACRERFFLDQGHIGYSAGALGLGGKLFLRERVFRSTFRLLPITANETPFTGSRGEGAVLGYRAGSLVHIRYIGAHLRDDTGAGSTAGLPLLHGGGDALHSLELDSRPVRWLRLGLAAQQVRSIPYGDSGLLAAGFGVDVAGLDLTCELARSAEGGWDDFGPIGLFDLDFGDLSAGSFSSIFSEASAFSAELNGLCYRSQRLGSVFIVPGYRFTGTEFSDPAGEIIPGLIESHLTAWWRHPTLDLQASLEARDTYCSEMAEGYATIHGLARARLTGGFDASGGVIYISDRDPAIVLTLLDENPNYRISATARIDSAGAGNVFSFLCSGSFNLTRSVAVRSRVYLYESSRSLHDISLEFRPRQAFLLAAGFGSYVPYGEEIAIRREGVLPEPYEERMITVSGRIWFGGL
jgi:hypothetical protein